MFYVTFSARIMKSEIRMIEVSGRFVPDESIFRPFGILRERVVCDLDL